jgi:hypothetical protein
MRKVLLVSVLFSLFSLSCFAAPTNLFLGSVYNHSARNSVKSPYFMTFICQPSAQCHVNNETCWGPNSDGYYHGNAPLDKHPVKMQICNSKTANLGSIEITQTKMNHVIHNGKRISCSPGQVIIQAHVWHYDSNGNKVNKFTYTCTKAPRHGYYDTISFKYITANNFGLGHEWHFFF